MAVTLSDFKSRFGKKSVDPVAPKVLYEKRLRDYKTKIEEILKSKAPEATLGKQCLLDSKRAADAGNYAKASDLLFEMNSKFPADIARRDRLTAALDLMYRENAALPEPPTANVDICTSARAAVASERYDEAEHLSGELRKGIDNVVKANVLAKQQYDARVGPARAEVQRAAIWASTQPNLQPQQLALPTKLAQALAAAIRQVDMSKNYVSACRKLDELAVQLQQVTPAVPKDTAPDKAWAARWSTEQAVLQPTADLIARTGGLPANVGVPGKVIATKLSEADKAGGEKRFDDALAALDEAGRAYGEAQLAAKAERDSARYALDLSLSLFKPANWPANAPQDVEKQRPALAQSEQTQTQAVARRDQVAALAEWLDKAAAWVEVEKIVAAAKQVDNLRMQKKLADDAEKQKQAYAKLVTDADPSAIADLLLGGQANLDQFRNQPGARELMDKIIKDIGTKADSPEQKRIVAALIKGRFAIEKGIIGGEDGKGLSSKALPRIYELLRKIPETHSSGETENDRFIKVIDRRKAHDTSWYASGDKSMVLKAGKTGGKNSKFDDTTLHEIGHAVDTKFSFMKSHGAGTEYGGWQELSIDDVLRVAGDELNFYKDMGTAPWNIPKALLETYLRACLSGKDPDTLQGQFETVNGTGAITAKELADHVAVKHALAGATKAAGDSDQQRDLFFAARKLVKDKEPRRSLVLAVAQDVAENTPVDKAIAKVLDGLKYTNALPSPAAWAIMAKHPAVDFASSARLKPGDDGLWDQGDSGAARCAVGGRVYQECYKNEWHSYALSARKTRLTNYQFRHPMEWFAESYAHFFMNKLPSSHAMHSWLTQQSAPQK